MSTPSRSRSSTRGDEGYFEWRETMERRQLESERQMQALLQETTRLREENAVLRIQVSSSDLLTTNGREAKERILGLTLSQCTLELQGSSLICAMSDLGNNPCPRIMLHKMKAQTLPISHQRDNVIKDPSCQTQCKQGWDHRSLVRRGRRWPQPRKRIPTPQSHPPSGTTPAPSGTTS
ncbi:hypothetical protein CK203_100863 [Vitis vinifera]|uniref:Uncharacterized protein n=1 Tax=Vitis vinifera TaxID=29760 RepID=A0A438CZH6_VITVI|nr:hypothetical protein CK203_100863 [Vitis vinifera]